MKISSTAARETMTHFPVGRRRRFRWLSKILNLNFLLGCISIGSFALIWEFARPLGIPLIGNLPPISEVITASKQLLVSNLYWEGWLLSVRRITLGFLIAQVVGVPLGLMMAMHRASFDTLFPVVEILRPIPPVAWIPVSIIFWPTRELSVLFIVFLGAFWIVLLNTIGGASNIDQNYKRAALSLGSSRRDLFRRIILPATIPSIITGMAVGIGIAWEMVVAAEMVAGRTGLGYLLWQSFEINAIAQCIVCMISIGIAGYISSEIIRLFGRYVAPWQARQ
ncbi:ABC transporter permease [Pseudorhodoplanes sp.]|uniref:ABC transporter permease n=1 Tax=Pseudorhodoplanes sp. TaxID=1934341 RepID=UPI003D11FE7C